MKGMATLPQGNQALLVVRDKVGSSGQISDRFVKKTLGGVAVRQEGGGAAGTNM